MEENDYREADLIIVFGIILGGIISIYTNSVIGLAAGSITGIVLAIWYKKRKEKKDRPYLK